MQKRVKIDRVRLERFEFKPLEKLKATLNEKPEIRQKLSEDFNGTLKAQGVTVDEDFKQRIRAEWRSTIKADVRRVADANPESSNWYLKRVLEDKPIKLRVKIDKETGEHKKSLRRSK
ncbi:hypothetical protein E4H04_06225 [Candidatus Bathyarchaeota archaeon]|jgi:hypothetical protein|nr:MAG: hypothetical protein E4H04_06225 [Candidatus Bathyarchaeota archaeon]